MTHLHAGRKVDNTRVITAGGAGEDLNFGACQGQALGGFDDVDVHTPGIAGAGLIEGAGVNRKQRYPTRIRRMAVRVGKREGAGRHELSVAHGADVGQWGKEFR